MKKCKRRCNDYDIAEGFISKEREWFPETWIYDINQANNSGELSLRRTIPDTITSWILTGFSISPSYGFGVSKSSTKIQVFQPFFISTNLPYSVKRGEIISVPFVVFNYMDKTVKAEVTLDNTNQEFVFVDVNKDGSEVPSNDTKRVKNVTITSENGENVSFLICPIKIGHIAIKVKAITPIAGDAVNDILRVEPEGVTKYENNAIYFNLKEKPEIIDEIFLNIPKDAIPDSVFIEISAVGDLLGPTIQNLGSLVRMPYGCGEQNMVNFVPNILVLKYLQCIGKLTAEIESKAKKFLEIGYQRELTFKHPDGSYSAFGMHDKQGSVWLTAYVARSFRQASEFILIDPDVIKQALQFLISIQNEDGSFPQIGMLHHQEMAGGSGRDLSLTAFCLLAFIEDKDDILEYKDTIEKGIKFLLKNINLKTYIYSVAITAYILQKTKHEKRDNILRNLVDRATFAGGIVHWDMGKGSNEEGTFCSAEITAYGILAVLESGKPIEIIPYLRGLLSKRNSAGGFESTQDTVVGLNALTKFSEKYYAAGAEVEINFNDDKGTKGKFVINDENVLCLQSHKLNLDARHVSVNVKGKGSSFVQISSRYNIDKREKRERFTLNAEVKETSKSELLELLISANFIPINKETVSNMVVMEITLPSGYLTDSDNIKELEGSDRIKRIETKNGNSVIVIYFDNLDSAEVSYLIRGIRAYQVAKQKPVPIIIYDYYDISRRAQTFYNSPQVTLNEILQEAY